MQSFNQFINDISDDETENLLNEFNLKSAGPIASVTYLLSQINQSSNVLKNLKFADDVEKKIALIAEQILRLNRSMLAIAAMVYFQTKKSKGRS
jgi:hypothetical protein